MFVMPQIHSKMPTFLLNCLILAFVTPIKAFEPSCPMIFDGRVPPIAEITSFDRNETPYGGFRGKNVKWSSILSFPQQVKPAVFDYDFGAKPIAIEINQDSVLRPANKPAETGHRQATLIFNRNNGSDESTKGMLSQMRWLSGD